MPVPDFVSLGQVKTFLRIDHAEDDELLTRLLAAATEAALDMANGLDLETTEPPERLATAILIHTRSLYEQPETAAPSVSVSALLQPFRKYEG